MKQPSLAEHNARPITQEQSEQVWAILDDAALRYPEVARALGELGQVRVPDSARERTWARVRAEL